MRKVYRAWIFSGLYFAVWLILCVLWFRFWDDVPNAAKIWGTLFLVVFGILGTPTLMARVTIDDSGIAQRFFKRRRVRWEDIISWERLGSPDSDCPDTIIIKTREGPFHLNGNCVFGKRLDDVETELRRRMTDARCNEKI